MNRTSVVSIMLILILAACQSAAAPAAAPQQPPAMAQPTQPPQPAAPAPLPTMKATGALPELRPPRSGGQLNPPTLAPTTSSRPIAGTTNWQTYRDNNYGLSFQYPSDWKPAITLNQSTGILQRIEVKHLSQPAGHNAEVLIDIRKTSGDLLAWLKKELPSGSLAISSDTIEGGLANVKNYNARIAGVPAIFIYAPEQPGSGTPTMAAVYVADTQYFYQFTYWGDIPDDLTNRAIYWQLLNTVAFTRTVTPGLILPKTTFTTGVITSTIAP
jgi:hypothetical protein